MNFDLYKIIFAMRNNIWILYIIIYLEYIMLVKHYICTYIYHNISQYHIYYVYKDNIFSWKNQ